MSEVQLRQSPADAVAEIRAFGSTVLRQAWRHEDLERIIGAIECFLEVRGRRIAEGRPEGSDRMLHAHGAGGFMDLMGTGLLDEGFLREMFQGSVYHRICAEFFQDAELYADPRRLMFRNHDPSSSSRTFVPYHQDSGSQNPSVGEVLNCWIPLDPSAGSEAPGLEVVRTPGGPSFPLKDFGLRTENAVYDPITIAREEIVARFGEDQFLAPTFDVGDGFVFSQDVIHRTYVTPGMTRQRRNFELRIFSLKHLRPGADVAEVRRGALRLA